MQYTTKYHLPQWEEDDRIMRTDFNEAMATIESSLIDIKSSVVGGYYTGNGTSLRFLCGFRPRVVLIYQVNLSSTSEASAAMTGAAFSSISNGLDNNCVIFEDTGFLLPTNSNYYPKINVKDQMYVYIAFR